VLEVVYHTLPIKKVHCRGQKVPVEAVCEFQPPCPRWHICNSYDLFEGYNLDCGDNRDDIDMSCKHGEEEATNHDQSPYCSSNKCLFFLFKLCCLIGSCVCLDVEAIISKSLLELVALRSSKITDLRFYEFSILGYLVWAARVRSLITAV
jgi:hypothetical protein